MIASTRGLGFLTLRTSGRPDTADVLDSVVEILAQLAWA